MALVVFLRGVNVGGHKRFRPSVVAHALREHGVVNVGAAGTFVVRKPGSRAAFRAALLRELPFETTVVMCDGRDLLRLETAHPFGADPPPAGVVWFLTIMEKAAVVGTPLPVSYPPGDAWLVRAVAAEGQFLFGMYRRDTKTITYLGRSDTLVDVPVTTRNWNTISTVIKLLKQ